MLSWVLWAGAAAFVLFMVAMMLTPRAHRGTAPPVASAVAPPVVEQTPPQPPPLRTESGIPVVQLPKAVNESPDPAPTPPPAPRTNKGCAAEGQTAQDRERAARICDGFPADADIIKVDVMETIAEIHMARGLYAAMRRDALSARKFGSRLVDDMRRETGSPVVSVSIYTEGVKVAQADVSWTGEKRFRFVDE